MTPVAPILAPAFVAAFRSGTLTPDQADAVLPRDRAGVIFFLLQLSLTVGSPAPAGGAHTPSGAVPPYAKPSATPLLFFGEVYRERAHALIAATLLIARRSYTPVTSIFARSPARSCVEPLGVRTSTEP